MTSVLTGLRGADVSALPDIHRIESDLDVALWVLLVARDECHHDGLTAAEVSDAATQVFRRPLTRQAAAHELARAKRYATKRPRATPSRYLLMQAGEARIRGLQQAVIMINPATAYSGLMQFDTILKGVDGHVNLCDPFANDKTLSVLTAVPTSVPIRFLTQNISDPPQLRRKFQAYQQEYGNVEIRVSSTGDLHDRYLIDSGRMWLLGTSLNGMGKKQSFVVSVGSDVRALTEREFQRRWNSAKCWPEKAA